MRLAQTFFAVVAAVVAALPAPAAAQSAVAPPTIVLDGRALANVKQRVGRDAAVQFAVQALARQADNGLTAGPYTVTAKSKTPPSGDKRDYMSQGRYFWPDPTKPNGLPYIRKDGETNPESRGGDEVPINDMASGVKTLALAYYFTGNERYAAHAALLLRTWFVDPATRMNPHMLYGQMWPGKNLGRSEGILDTRCLLQVVDAVSLLDGSRSLAATDRVGIQQWFKQYAEWLRTSEFGREEASGRNNHGTWCDTQLAAFSLFAGDLPTARRVLLAAKMVRCTEPIEPDGRQPAELARADAFGYSIFNLEALSTLAEIGRRIDIDLWDYRSADGRGIRVAAEWLLPYASGEKSWTFGKKPATGHNDSLVELYRQLAVAFGDERFERLSTSLPESKESRHTVFLSLEHPLLTPEALASIPKPERRMVPPPAAVAAPAVAAVRSRLASELNARSAGRDTLVRKLATSAMAEGVDPLERYAMLSIAREIAADPFDLSLVHGVLLVMSESFQLDPMRELESELSSAARKAGSQAETAAAALDAVNLATRNGEFAAANKFIAIASRSAASSKDATLTQRISDRRAGLARENSLYQAYQRAQSTISKRPADSAARLAVGKWLCFGANQWERGLEQLEKGNNGELAALAAACRGATEDGPELRRRGDLWWDRAQHANASMRRDLERGARHFYSLAVGKVADERGELASRLAALGGPEQLPRHIDLLAAGSPAALATSSQNMPAEATGSSVPVSTQPSLEPNREAASLVLKHGGSLTVQPGGGAAVVLTPSEALPSMSFVVLKVDLTNAKGFGDDELKTFGSLEALEELILDKTSVGDAGLVYIGTLKTLKMLFVDDTGRVTDAGLSSIAGLTTLIELRLKRQKVTDAGLKHLASLTSLESLRLAYNQSVTDAGVEALSHVPKLRYVNAEGTTITSAGAQRARELRSSLRIRIGG